MQSCRSSPPLLHELKDSLDLCTVDWLGALWPSLLTWKTLHIVVMPPPHPFSFHLSMSSLYNNLPIVQWQGAFMHWPAVKRVVRRSWRLTIRLVNYCWVRHVRCSILDLRALQGTRSGHAVWVGGMVSWHSMLPIYCIYKCSLCEGKQCSKCSGKEQFTVQRT